MPKLILPSCYFFSLMVAFSCSCEKVEESKDLKDLVLGSFDRYNKKTLNDYDSCFFVNTLKQGDLKNAGGSLLREIYGVEILSYTISSIDFSFAMMKSKNEVNWTFFGAFENYMLSHSNRNDSANLVIVKNDNLNLVVNKFFTSTLVSSDSISLKVFLHELYYENYKGLYRPIFDEDVRVTNLSEYLTKDQIDVLGDSDNLIVFKDSVFGLTIFKWTVKGKLIEISQFIFPFGKYKFLGGSDVPPAFRGCDNLD